LLHLDSSLLAHNSYRVPSRDRLRELRVCDRFVPAHKSLLSASDRLLFSVQQLSFRPSFNVQPPKFLAAASRSSRDRIEHRIVTESPLRNRPSFPFFCPRELAPEPPLNLATSPCHSIACSVVGEVRSTRRRQNKNCAYPAKQKSKCLTLARIEIHFKAKDLPKYSGVCASSCRPLKFLRILFHAIFQSHPMRADSMSRLV